MIVGEICVSSLLWCYWLCGWHQCICLYTVLHTNSLHQGTSLTQANCGTVTKERMKSGRITALVQTHSCSQLSHTENLHLSVSRCQYSEADCCYCGQNSEVTEDDFQRMTYKAYTQGDCRSNQSERSSWQSPCRSPHVYALLVTWLEASMIVYNYHTILCESVK